MSDHGVAGLVLAAGAGTRFGQPKPLVSLGGQSLLERAVAVLVAGGCRRPICVVLGGVLRESLPTIAEMQVTWNPGWRAGLASSLRHGLDELETDTDVRAAVIVLVDQPGIQAAAVERVITAYGNGAVVAVATYMGGRGHPVLLDRAIWPEVRALAAGDDGARAFMAAHPETVTEVVCDDAGTTDDIDTQADLARFERDLQKGTSARCDRDGDGLCPDRTR